LEEIVEVKEEEDVIKEAEAIEDEVLDEVKAVEEQ
jgi:hypothetical protein